MSDEFKEISQEEIDSIKDELKDRFFIIEEVLKDKSSFKETLDSLYGYVLRAFEVKEIREHPIYFKFKKEDTDIHQLQIRHFITNMMFWEGYLKVGAVSEMNETSIFDCTNPMYQISIENYFNEKLIEPYRKRVSNSKLSRTVEKILSNLSKISNDFNDILAQSMSIEMFLDMKDRVPEYNDIIRTKINENMQPTEIETTLNDLRKKELQILTRPDSPLRSLLVTGSGINTKQLSEFSISGGLKPDLDYCIVPLCSNV